ncbi:hypothetical protein [Staphylococcus saprophyticus]|nr:hypothetical protein [Staphylococcus saprophyticus]
MLGINGGSNKSGPLREEFGEGIMNYYDNEQLIEWGKELGDGIGI